MPYRTIEDLPEAQTDQYNRHQKEAFLKAFNNAYEQYGGDESQPSPWLTQRRSAQGKTRARMSPS